MSGIGRTSATGVAFASWAFSALLTLGTWLVIALTLDKPVGDQFGLRGMNSLPGLAFATVGFAIARRRPGHRVGWLFCAIGVITSLNGILVEWASISAVAIPGTPAIHSLAAWLLGWLWVPLLGLTLVAVPLLYPSGTLPSPRWRPVGYATAGSIALAVAAMALAPGPIDNAATVVNPFGLPVDPETYAALVPLYTLPLAVCALLALASLVRRYRTSGRDTQLQIKWLALASSLAVVGFALVAVTAAGPNPGPVGKAAESLLLLSILAIALAVGVAILRYRLYEIDRIISRSVGWTAVTAMIAGVFGAGVVGLQQLLAGVTQGQTLAVAMSTLIALALFQPLRLRVQRWVDQRFDRARYDAERTAAAFATRLRDRLDLTRLEADVSDTVHAAMRPRSLGLWVRGAATGVSRSYQEPDAANLPAH